MWTNLCASATPYSNSKFYSQNILLQMSYSMSLDTLKKNYIGKKLNELLNI